MDGSFTSFVGIDVAKRTLDVHVLPQGTALSFAYDPAGLKQLQKALPEPGTSTLR